MILGLLFFFLRGVQLRWHISCKGGSVPTYWSIDLLTSRWIGMGMGMGIGIGLGLVLKTYKEMIKRV